MSAHHAFNPTDHGVFSNAAARPQAGVGQPHQEEAVFVVSSPRETGRTDRSVLIHIGAGIGWYTFSGSSVMEGWG